MELELALFYAFHFHFQTGWTQISHRKLKNSISHSVVILASEPDVMLNIFFLKPGVSGGGGLFRCLSKGGHLPIFIIFYDFAGFFTKFVLRGVKTNFILHELLFYSPWGLGLRGWG